MITLPVQIPERLERVLETLRNVHTTSNAWRRDGSRAGAIISGGAGTAASKVEALEAAEFRVAGSPTELPALLRDAGYTG